MFAKEFNFEADVSLEGIKLALVVDNDDPLCIERIRVRVLGIHDMNNTANENSIWAHHIAPSKQTSGEIPDKNDWLYVLFPDKTTCEYCLWFGWVRHAKL
jgi:hypothetical protein